MIESFSPSPTLVFILLIAIAYGALFHLWKGHRWQDLGLFILAAIIGMGIGQLLGPLLGMDLVRIGQIYFLEATVMAWLFMLAAAWQKG